jgi:uncharacterized protein YjbI with pentapeptide repeats
MATYIGRSSTGSVADEYLEKWSLYNATMSGNWDKVIIVDALPNSIIEMTMVNNSGQNDVGVRMVGSSLNRAILSIANSATTMIVKTNSNKEVEFFTSDFTDTNFYFSSQL